MIEDFELAKERGIVAPYAKGFMAYDSVNGNIRTDYNKTAKMLAQDAAITPANVGVPSAFTTYIDPKIVQILFAKTAATKLGVEAQVGKWTDNSYTFPVEELAGDVEAYSDFQNGSSVDVNYEFPVREQFRFQTTLKYGDFEAELAAAAKLSLVAGKQRASASIIERAQNKFYLFGVEGKEIYGLLNDPNLPDSISPISANGKSTWADKKADSTADFANRAYDDIVKLITELQKNNGGNIDANTPMILGISNARNADLTNATQFGKTAKGLLLENYPNIQIEVVPELSDTTGETLYLIVPEYNGDITAQPSYSEKYRLGRLIPRESHFSQKAIGTTFGTVIKRPSLIAIMKGI